MQGLKMILLGIAFILIGGFILLDPRSSFGGVGEVAIFTVGIILGIKGLQIKD